MTRKALVGFLMVFCYFCGCLAGWHQDLGITGFVGIFIIIFGVAASFILDEESSHD